MTDNVFVHRVDSAPDDLQMLALPNNCTASESADVSLNSKVQRTSWRGALSSHWPEYLMEGAELGLFMISACAFVVLLEHPASPVHQAIENNTLRRVLIGLAMGLTAIAIIYSPIGQRSGAHFNPSVTLFTKCSAPNCTITMISVHFSL